MRVGKFKNGKITGKDEINGKMIKGDRVEDWIWRLCNVLENGVVPKGWEARTDHECMQDTFTYNKNDMIADTLDLQQMNRNSPHPWVPQLYRTPATGEDSSCQVLTNTKNFIRGKKATQMFLWLSYLREWNCEGIRWESYVRGKGLD